MVKSTCLFVALAALAGHNVMAQANIPTSDLGNIDPSVLSSAIAHAESTLSAMKTDPSFSSILSNPTVSSLIAQGSSAAGSLSPSGSSGSNATPSGGTTLQQPTIGLTVLVISTAVAVGFL